MVGQLYLTFVQSSDTFGRIMPCKGASKILIYCHGNGQSPTLSMVCNILIIPVQFKKLKKFPHFFYAVRTTS